MSSSGCRSVTARASSLGPHVSTPTGSFSNGAIAGEIRSCVQQEREAHAVSDVHATDDDYWAAAVDLLILRVADRLRRAGADMPEVELRRVAEEAVLEAARFVLDWAEAPAAAVAMQPLHGPRAPSPVVASPPAADSETASR